jgi:transcriptional regulator with GAF, ATPase, and Fis domain
MADASQTGAALMHRFLGIAPKTSEEQVLRLLVETGVRTVSADEGSLLVYSPETNDLTFVMSYGNPESEALLMGQRVPFGQGSLAGLAAQTGEVQIGAPRFKDVRQTEAMDGINAVISAPMMLGDRLIGVITAVSTDPTKRFTMADAEIYACLATIGALVVNQALLLSRAPQPGDLPAPLPAAYAADPVEREVMERVVRLLQRDPETVRQVARMLEAIEAMAPGGTPR